ncbi:toxin-antitoxin system YwqK family antitoxin [Pedobacter agri]|uniref:toxin-antitoxin system YwqK family antitoxin n=1 Tax=Pedobacter agri TaxID=454586 RepID=UPI00292F72BE|nr:hypothetical protein [Pedobacter agri]
MINNQQEGIAIVYYATGEKYITSNYQNGMLDGDCIVYSKSGEIIFQETYSEGKLSFESKHLITESNNLSSNAEDVDMIELFDKLQMDSFTQQKQEYNLVREQEKEREEKNDRSGILGSLKKLGTTVSGLDAVKYRKSSIKIKEASESLFDSAFEKTEVGRQKLNKNIIEFGDFRLKSLKKTTGRFLGLLKDMGQENRVKEYEILEGIGIDIQTIEKMENIDMNVSKALQNSASIGAVGAAAALGTPALVTGAVGALATASTGTAISSLGGVAATNATLAWLGGGSLATGGGGMAAGATLLTGLTMSATAGVALIATGLIASTYYSKKLTETKEYQKEVECKVEGMEKLWVLMNGINARTQELKSVTLMLQERFIKYLEMLEPLTVDYDSNHNYYNRTFQRVGLLAKSMSELAQTPLLDAHGNTSNQSAEIIELTYKVLNHKLINHG